MVPATRNHGALASSKPEILTGMALCYDTDAGLRRRSRRQPVPAPPRPATFPVTCDRAQPAQRLGRGRQAHELLYRGRRARSHRTLLASPLPFASPLSPGTGTTATASRQAPTPAASLAEEKRCPSHPDQSRLRGEGRLHRHDLHRLRRRVRARRGPWCASMAAVVRAITCHPHLAARRPCWSPPTASRIHGHRLPTAPHPAVGFLGCTCPARMLSTTRMRSARSSRRSRRPS